MAVDIPKLSMATILAVVQLQTLRSLRSSSVAARSAINRDDASLTKVRRRKPICAATVPDFTMNNNFGFILFHFVNDESEQAC